MSSPARVLVVGGSNLDSLAVSSAPLQARTSNPGRRLDHAGGVGRNVAENLARLGTTTRLVTSVGDDPVGARVLEETRAAGVEVVPIPYDGATGTYTALIDADGSLVAGIADMAATEAITAGAVPDGLIAETDWLVLDGNLPADTVNALIRLAAEHAVPVVLDPVSAPKAARLRLDDDALHTITPTADELAALDRTPEELLDRVGVVWLREGADGSRLFRPDEAPARVQLPPVAPVDVTGAGDAMLAGYVHALVGGADVVAAAWYGAAAALLTVQSPHPVDPELSEARVLQVLHENEVPTWPHRSS